MRRVILGAIAAVALLTGAFAINSTMAGAATNGTATGVQPATSDFNCADADLDISYSNLTTTQEKGQVTNEAGTTLSSFSDPDYVLTNATATNTSWGAPISPDQPAGTIIGSYGALANGSYSSTTAIEFFVLYQCGLTDGTSTVLYTCYGDYGTCPQTAIEGIAATSTTTTTAPTTPTTTAPKPTTTAAPAAAAATATATAPTFTG